MPQWLRLIEQAQDYINAGEAPTASDLLRKGLAEFAEDKDAIAWLTFNLMQSEIVSKGPEIAQTLLPRIIETCLSWPAKLYALELALASAKVGGQKNKDLYQLTREIIKGYCAQDINSAEINIMSCQSIVRRLEVIFPDMQLSDEFLCSDNMLNYAPHFSMPSNPTAPPTPVSYNRLPNVLRIYSEHYTPPQQPLSFRHVGKAFIVRLGENTILYDRNGEPLDVPYGAYPKFLKTLLRDKFLTLSEGRHLYGTSIFIGDYFSQVPNYCHWVFDTLPRIVAAKLMKLNFDHVIGPFKTDIPFISSTLPLFLTETQTYHGFDTEDGLIGIENLLFADNVAVNNLGHPAFGGDATLVTNLRQQLLVSPSTSQKKRRLYVPRRNTRVVLNETELIQLLRQYGFEIIDTDTMDVLEQIDTFSSAEVVIGPHGAALTNMLYMPPSSKILELFPPFGGSASFYLISSSLNIGYSCYIDDVSQGPNRDDTEHVQLNTSGIWVDLEYVQAWLRSHLPPTP